MSRLLGRVGISVQVSVIGVVALLGFVLTGVIYSIAAQQQSLVDAEMSAVNGRRLTMNQILVDLLQLRRHEKDFLLRHDEKYVAEHGKVVVALNGEISALLDQKLT